MSALIPHSRPRPTEEEIAAVTRALRAGHLAQGEEVAHLEQALSRYYGGIEAVAVSSGTAALALALVALGVTPGRRVIIPSYTCQSLYAAVCYAGGAALCADVGAQSVCLAPETVRLLGGDPPAALIAPHTCGFTAALDSLRACGCPLIEDAAQAFGGRYADGTPLGSRGDIAVLSFYGTKLLPAGEGGACLTRRPETADLLRRLRNCDEQPLHPKAFNFKMADLNAALALAALARLPETLARRAAIATRFDDAFGPRAFRRRSSVPQAVCFRYLVETDRPIASVLDAAAAQGIQCRRPIWRPLHTTLGGACPRTEDLHARLISVPIYPGLADAEIERLCAILPELVA